MSFGPKVKILATRVLTPKISRGSGFSRRSFPAWIDAGERGVSFGAAIVVPRVRDALVLRVVRQARETFDPRRNAHGAGAR